ASREGVVNISQEDNIIALVSSAECRAGRQHRPHSARKPANRVGDPGGTKLVHQLLAPQDLKINQAALMFVGKLVELFRSHQTFGAILLAVKARDRLAKFRANDSQDFHAALINSVNAL